MRLKIAKELKIYEHSAYYYIKKLILYYTEAIKEIGTDFVQGGTAKLYQTSSPSFGIEMPWGEKQLNSNSFEKDNNHIKNEITKKFLKGFINNDNFFEGLIIVKALLILMVFSKPQQEMDIMQSN